MIPREIIVGKLPTGKYFNQRYDTDKLPDKDRGKYFNQRNDTDKDLK